MLKFGNIDLIRRECIRIGMTLHNGPSAQAEREAIAKIQQAIERPVPEIDAETIVNCGKQLESFEVPEEAKRPEFRSRD